MSFAPINADVRWVLVLSESEGCREAERRGVGIPPFMYCVYVCVYRAVLGVCVYGWMWMHTFTNGICSTHPTAPTEHLVCYRLTLISTETGIYSSVFN